MAADEAGDEGVARMVEDLARGAGLGDAAVVHDDDQIGQRHGFFLTMGHVDEADAEPPLKALQLLPHLYPQERIERRQRLVQQQGAGVGDQRAGKRHALLLPTGKLGRQALRILVHLDKLEQFHRLGPSLRFGHALQLETEGDIVHAVEVREQRVALEHHGCAAPGRRQIVDVRIAEQNIAVGDGLMAGDHAKGGGLAAAARPKQTAVSPGWDLEVDQINGGRAAIEFGDRSEFDISRSGHLHSLRVLACLNLLSLVSYVSNLNASGWPWLP